MDVILAVVVFGFITVTFTSFALIDRGDIDSLEQQAQLVVTELTYPLQTCNNIPLLQDNSLDQNVTSCVFAQNYSDLKELVNTDSDFCMYLEDGDGNIIPIRINDTTSKKTIGSSEISVGGQPCGQ